MKRFLSFLFAALALLSLSLPVLAQDDSLPFWQKSDELIVVGENEVVDRDFYGGAGRVEIYGVVNGDIFTAGGQVLIDGQVNGDVLAAGGTVEVAGVVSQDIRIAGGQLMISGQVGKNVTFVGGNINVVEGARIGGSVLGAGGSVSISSPVAKNITVGAGSLVLAGQVGGDVEAGVGTLRLTPEAEVLGDLTYWSDNEASIADGSIVSGQTIRREPKKNLNFNFDNEVGQTEAKNVWKGIKTFFTLTSFVSSLLIGLILIWLFPKFSKEASSVIGQKSLAVFGLGLVGLVVVPPLAVILLITVFGIPLSLILSAFYVLSIYLSKIFVSIFIGSLVFSWLKVKAKMGWVFVAGLSLYFITRNIVFIGWLVALLSLFFGLGAFWLTLRNSFLSAGKKK